MMDIRIPLVDLRAQHRAIRDELDRAIAAVFEEASFIRGRHVGEFEENFARACGVKRCVSCANGTDALYIALKMLGVGEGDEVITPANSWIASSETITQAGASPVFVDVEADCYNLDVGLLRKAVTERTKAVIAVHLFGLPAQIDEIRELCSERGIQLIEDCAQAHMAEFGGVKVGGFGEVGTFSFYPGKNLGAYGDAGAIVTNNEELADRMQCFARHGASPTSKHDHVMEGVNSRMDGIQAAALNVKLPRLAEWTERRKEKAEVYTEALKDVPGIKTPRIRDGGTHVFHVYAIRCAKRDALRDALTRNGIGTGVHYPTPLPLLEAYARLGHSVADFPVAARNSREFLSLPLYPELKDSDQREIIRLIAEFATDDS